MKFKNSKIKLILGAFLLASVSLYAANIISWKIDNSHTSVNFTATHFFSEVTGNFTEFSGDVNFDPDNLEESTVSFNIPVTSINTGDAKRDKHLQTDDFFNAKKYPNITFKSTKFVKKEDGTLAVLGNLTIRDQTKLVGLPFKVTGRMDHPMMKNTEIIGISLKTKLDRNSFGVGTGSWAATAVVGDEVLVNVNMEMNRKK